MSEWSLIGLDTPSTPYHFTVLELLLISDTSLMQPSLFVTLYLPRYSFDFWLSSCISLIRFWSHGYLDFTVLDNTAEVLDLLVQLDKPRIRIFTCRRRLTEKFVVERFLDGYLSVSIVSCEELLE